MIIQKLKTLNPFLFLFFIFLNASKVAIIQAKLANATITHGWIPTETTLISFVLNFLFFTLIYSALYFRKKRWWFLVFYILQIFYYVIHIAYYDFFGNHLNLLQSIFLFKEGLDVLLIGAVPLHRTMLYLFLDIPLFLFLIINFKNQPQFILKKHKSLMIASLVSYFLLISLFLIFHLPKQIKEIKKNRRGTIFKNERIVAVYGMLYHNIIATVHYSLKEKNHVKGITYGQYKEKQFPVTPKEKLPSFIFLQLESFQSGMIEYRYKNKLVMPYLSQLSKDKNTLYLPYMLSYHDGGGSSDAEWSIFNNIESLMSFPGFILDGYKYTNSFVTSFEKMGYSNYLFHNNYRQYFNRDKVYHKMGFHRFFDIYSLPYAKKLKRKWGVHDGPMFDYTFEKTMSMENPFFFQVINMTTHAPCNFLKNIYQNDAYKKSKSFNFLNSFSYLDLELKKFVENIKKLNKNIYLVIYGDHSAKSLPNMKRPTITIDHAKMEFVPFMIVPLFEEGKGTHSLKITDKEIMSGFHDVGPTILELGKIDYGYCFFGDNLLDENLSDKIYFKGQIFSRKNLYKRIQKEFPLMQEEKN